ncbi:MAG: TetR/AcrR family transcriptional regulator [Rhodospirillaceae bacterium]|nr:MAG: TetR/AcrR family transcriptional regulator [Rhodospirillaceae bacterium]
MDFVNVKKKRSRLVENPRGSEKPMRKAADDAISKLEPEGLLPEGEGWQQRKSSETRIVILEATIECLARYGYARTTTQLIAKIAKVSRGAMIHHYATKQELIAAVTEYAFYKHMERFSRAIRALSDEERIDRNAGIEADWRVCLSREYKAYFELHVAARTDEELNRIFMPCAIRHDQAWTEELLHVFPEWRDKRDKLILTRKFVRAALAGMVLHHDIWDDPEAESSLLRMIASAVKQIREGDLAASSPGETVPAARKRRRA